MYCCLVLLLPMLTNSTVARLLELDYDCFACKVIQERFGVHGHLQHDGRNNRTYRSKLST